MTNTNENIFRSLFTSAEWAEVESRQAASAARIVEPQSDADYDALAALEMAHCIG